MRDIHDDVAIGEADRGLDFNGHLASVEQTFPSPPGHSPDLLPDSQHANTSLLLSCLEREPVLIGRVTAYQQHNSRLEARAQELNSMSQVLEDRYRKMVSICTGVPVEQVDGEMLDHLVQAIVSEQGRGRNGDGEEAEELQR